MIERSMSESTIIDKVQYFVRDDFGVLVFTDLSQYKTNIIIGDNSLLTSYQYEISTDKDTYNTVKIVRNNDDAGSREAWIKFDSNNQRQWGKLQLFIEANKEDNEGKINELAAGVLALKNRQTKTMKLTVLGDLRLFAGAGFLLKLSSLEINQFMWITSAVHSFDVDNYTCSLEVAI